MKNVRGIEEELEDIILQSAKEGELMENEEDIHEQAILLQEDSSSNDPTSPINTENIENLNPSNWDKMLINEGNIYQSLDDRSQKSAIGVTESVLESGRGNSFVCRLCKYFVVFCTIFSVITYYILFFNYSSRKVMASWLHSWPIILQLLNLSDV